MADVEGAPAAGFPDELLEELGPTGPAPRQVFQTKPHPRLAGEPNEKGEPVKGSFPGEAIRRVKTQAHMDGEELPAQLGDESADAAKNFECRVGLVVLQVSQVYPAEGAMVAHL